MDVKSLEIGKEHLVMIKQVLKDFLSKQALVYCLGTLHASTETCPVNRLLNNMTQNQNHIN